MAAEHLQVAVVTPLARLAQGEAAQLVAPSCMGQLTILPQHAPLLCDLRPGVVSLGGGAKAQHFFIDGGFLEVGHDRVTVLAEHAEPLAKLDAAQAKEALAAADKRLAGLAADDPSYAAAQAEAACAQAKVEAATQGPGTLP